MFWKGFCRVPHKSNYTPYTLIPVGVSAVILTVNMALAPIVIQRAQEMDPKYVAVRGEIAFTR